MIICKLKGNIALIPDTALYFAAAAHRCGVSKKRADMLCFVLEGALELRMQDLESNNQEITVGMMVRDSDVIVSITDQGIPYVPSDSQKRMLRRGLVDSFRFEQLGADGQRISFYILRDDISHVIENEPHKQEEMLDNNISFHLTSSEQDIMEVIRCIYSVWKYKYVHEDYYYINYYTNLLKSGRYVSVLAKNEHGQIIGHAALHEQDWFPGIPEMCNLVVKPFAQGLHMSERLQDAVCKAGIEKGVEGFHVIPVTMHSRSQVSLIKAGFTPSAMLFHYYGPGKAGPMWDGKSRLDATLAVHILNKEKLHSLYLPEECADYIRNIFDREKLKYEELTAEETAEKGKQPQISYYREAGNRSLDIKIDSLGSGSMNNLEWLRSQNDEGPVDVITVYINMNDHSCPALYHYLRKKGYIFTGCLPGSRKGDYILMQDLKGLPIESEKHRLDPEFKKMADIIIKMKNDISGR